MTFDFHCCLLLTLATSYPRVTNGLYVNVSLHDYLRAIANVPATDSTWTLDPRVEVKKIFDKRGTPRGIGNHVSCEFNLLYRFHSAISDRDAKWTEEFYHSLFAGEGSSTDTNKREDPSAKFFRGIMKYEKSIPANPAERTFSGLQRGKDGKFNDEDLVKILKESIEDPAGVLFPYFLLSHPLADNLQDVLVRIMCRR